MAGSRANRGQASQLARALIEARIPSMAYTLQQLQDLRAAIAEGVLMIRTVDGQEVRYRSLDEMRRIEASMAAQLEPAVPRIKRSYYTFSRE
jgi:hypothetical protein